MLKIIAGSFIFLCLSVLGYGQTNIEVETGPQPQGGTNQVALTYYKINFTKEQRLLLEAIELELIFKINKIGTPTLEKVNGINDPAILDSLTRTSLKLPAFIPGKENGVAVNSVYFIKFSFPKYRTVVQPTPNYTYGFGYKTYKLEDFEYIQKSGSRIDILMGGVVNNLMGNAGDHLSLGGGLKIDMLFTGKKGLGGGMMMSFYGNKLKTPYPINSIREQNAAPPTLLLGLVLNKFMAKKERQEINMQLEMCYAIQNITARIDEADKEWTQFQGFSPGLVANYILKLGKDKPSYYYGSPILYAHYLNLHGAIRPLFFGNKRASGVMLEAGLSYRIGMHQIREYRLKPEA